MENLARIIAEHPFCKELETYYLDLLTSCAPMFGSRRTSTSFEREAKPITFI